MDLFHVIVCAKQFSNNAIIQIESQKKENNFRGKHADIIHCLR
jgi:hypothetical protein